MPLWPSKGDKKDKNKEKPTKKLVGSRSDGDIVHSSGTSSFTRQESSISQTTEIRTKTTVVKTFGSSSSFGSQISPKTSSSTSLQRYDFKSPFFDIPNPKLTAIDAQPFKPAPARSVFTSPPLTGASKPINLNYQSPYAGISARKASLPTQTAVPSISPKTNLQLSSRPDNDKELRSKLKVKVVKSLKFYDDASLSKVPIYKTRSKRRGKLLLINNMKFADGKERKGAQFDEENVFDLFKQMRFEVVKHRDLTKKQMEDRITSFRKDFSLQKYDIATVIIMSHGYGQERSDSTEVACIDEQLLQTTWIIQQFDSDLCPQLRDKPKIFIFQCCRGDNHNMIQTDTLPFTPRLQSDMLIAYSTVPGYVSHRDPTTGSWYMQAVCRVFMEHAHDTDVENLLKIVDNRLTQAVSNGLKQTSSFENRGFKTCYFHPQLFE